MKLKTGDVARRLGICPNTVREYVNRGLIKCTVLPTGVRLYDEEDIAEFEKQSIQRVAKGVKDEEQERDSIFNSDKSGSF